jgi:hypothetical protein
MRIVAELLAQLISGPLLSLVIGGAIGAVTTGVLARWRRARAKR